MYFLLTIPLRKLLLNRMSHEITSIASSLLARELISTCYYFIVSLFLSIHFCDSLRSCFIFGISFSIGKTLIVVGFENGYLMDFRRVAVISSVFYILEDTHLRIHALETE